MLYRLPRHAVQLLGEGNGKLGRELLYVFVSLPITAAPGVLCGCGGGTCLPLTVLPKLHFIIFMEHMYNVLFTAIFLFILYIFFVCFDITLLYNFCQIYVHQSTAYVDLIHKLVKVWFLII